MGGSLPAAVPVNAGAGKGPGCPYLTLGSPSRFVPRDLNESLTHLPLGRSVLPPSPRSDNRIQSKDASQILMLTVRTPYAHRPPPPAIKSHFCTSCVLRCLPSTGISGKARYGQSGQWRPGSKAGRKFGDYPVPLPCLTNGTTEAQDVQAGDLRSRRDGLTLLLLQHRHDGALPSPAHLTS